MNEELIANLRDAATYGPVPCPVCNEAADALESLSAECTEQARLLCMSAEREADLLGEIERLERLARQNSIAAADKRIAELTELAEKMSIAAMEERHRRIEVYGDLKVAREAMSKAASLECNGVIRVALAQIGGDDVPR